MFIWFSKKDRKIANLEAMVKNRDKLIQTLETDRKIYKAENKELKKKITDLENNIEILSNNLSAAKKKQLGL